eukprot:CAMPEP_0113468834 /NCGR_PEP_ID=MMETSP0014_2-20120614/15571_1 /TAXON_ID=2857 /ORGANISM="Nitzschia sp." /LENGTH=280 /DNA_ID=CAMNT_0000361259 /DNA_START=222 /DNA_END=1064 /DNA_ORIENTATION=+ /assembly_acc=CAM_ASM_000159
MSDINKGSVVDGVAVPEVVATATVLATEATPLAAGKVTTTTTITPTILIFDCFSQGLCHPSLWCACCCPLLLMGQVLTRLKMTWYGTTTTTTTSATDGSGAAYRRTFWTVLGIFITYCVACSLLGCPPEPPSQDDVEELKSMIDDDSTITQIQQDVDQMALDYEACPGWKPYVLSCIQCVMGLYTLVVMIRLRRAVRTAYRIPPRGCCGGPSGDCGDVCAVEDCCCVFWCTCCTVSQLARQTADYDRIRAVCCSTTGLPSDVEADIPLAAGNDYYTAVVV